MSRIVYIHSPMMPQYEDDLDRRCEALQYAKRLVDDTGNTGVISIPPALIDFGVILHSCDAMYFLQGWHKDAGSVCVMDVAQYAGLEIFTDIRALDEAP